jgi:hypothetical protein
MSAPVRARADSAGIMVGAALVGNPPFTHGSERIESASASADPDEREQDQRAYHDNRTEPEHAPIPPRVGLEQVSFLDGYANVSATHGFSPRVDGCHKCGLRVTSCVCSYSSRHCQRTLTIVGCKLSSNLTSASVAPGLAFISTPRPLDCRPGERRGATRNRIRRRRSE